MCAPKAPAPPDPKETSAASTSTNVGTAIANSFLGNVNQNTPDGTLTYDQSGTYQWNDPYTGKTYDVPRFTATQTLSPQQQAIKEQTDAAQLNLGKLANQQSGFLGEYLNKPFEYNNQDVENWAYDLGSQRLDPRFAREEESLRTRLINSGIREGSDAWNAEMGRATEGKNDAYNQLMLQGRSQAYQEAVDTRSRPINEITALLSGSQVSQPNFVNANMPTIPTTDTAGLINANYNQRLAQHQANNQNILGGLFGMGAAFLGNPAVKFSDERLKEDVEKVGKTNDGQNIYSYRYKGNPTPQMGLMAQEVARKHPKAVTKTRGGLMAVHYDKALKESKK